VAGPQLHGSSRKGPAPEDSQSSTWYLKIKTLSGPIRGSPSYLLVGAELRTPVRECPPLRAKSPE